MATGRPSAPTRRDAAVSALWSRRLGGHEAGRPAQAGGGLSRAVRLRGAGAERALGAGAAPAGRPPRVPTQISPRQAVGGEAPSRHSRSTRRRGPRCPPSGPQDARWGRTFAASTWRGAGGPRPGGPTLVATRCLDLDAGGISGLRTGLRARPSRWREGPPSWPRPALRPVGPGFPAASGRPSRGGSCSEPPRSAPRGQRGRGPADAGVTCRGLSGPQARLGLGAALAGGSAAATCPPLSHHLGAARDAEAPPRVFPSHSVPWAR